MAKHQIKMLRYENEMKKLNNKIPAFGESIEEIETEEIKIGAEEIAEHFSPDEITELNSMSILKKCDREFVGKVLQMLYKENPEHLCNLTVSKTRTKNMKLTKVMSTQKIGLITALMHQRAIHMSDEIEKVSRTEKEYINQTISRALFHERNSMLKCLVNKN